jgi:hypothetical protein
VRVPVPQAAGVRRERINLSLISFKGELRKAAPVDRLLITEAIGSVTAAARALISAINEANDAISLRITVRIECKVGAIDKPREWRIEVTCVPVFQKAEPIVAANDKKHWEIEQIRFVKS